MSRLSSSSPRRRTSEFERGLERTLRALALLLIVVALAMRLLASLGPRGVLARPQASPGPNAAPAPHVVTPPLQPSPAPPAPTAAA